MINRRSGGGALAGSKRCAPRGFRGCNKNVHDRNHACAPKCSPHGLPEAPSTSSLAPVACTTCATVAAPLLSWRLTLLRAKPSKDGDAEPRDYGDMSRYVRRVASETTQVDVGGLFFCINCFR